MTQRAQRWDVFCSVVDNYGDAGVCWRLARQLVAEHSLEVRLFVDALPALTRIAPSIDATLEQQRVDGVDIRSWSGPQDERFIADPRDAVIEAFGCGLPQPYLAAMAALERQPPWINLEYLSAEAWIEGCHGLASRHPRLPLTRHFFFPGFTRASGGLLRERDLFEQRDRFRADPAAQDGLWRRLGLVPPSRAATVISLFCYPNAPIGDLLATLASGNESTLGIVPEGVAASAVQAWSEGAISGPNQHVIRGSLTLACVPFLSQQEYDRLLWCCDLNFVRGEDSFVRAQWAARPFIWQPYPQSENAHRLKLEAFLQRYTDGCVAALSETLREVSSAWNSASSPAAAWASSIGAREEWSTHAELWADGLARHPDLAENLVRFCADRV